MWYEGLISLLSFFQHFHITGTKMTKAIDVNEDDVVKNLNKVSKAMRTAQLTLLESGFQERVADKKSKKRKQKKGMS